ncbi:MAG: methionine synthase [Mycobacteriales bacterium]|nr:methionine synthase [Frankia sp.]
MARPEPPWTGAATGVGSLPHHDPHAATRFVFDTLAELPHLPELPARGPGADTVGRTAAVLSGLYVDRQPSGWRFVARPGVDHRRAVDFLARDLDALEEHAADYAGPLKLQLAGPWTLAAGVELTRGDRALADRGAVRDVAAALVEAVRAHAADVQRRVPRAQLVVQLDEPALPAVLAGAVPTASGFGALAPVDAADAQSALAEVLASAAETGPAGVHCCAAQPPIALLRDAGARFVSVDLALVEPAADDELGECVAAGIALWLGLVPTSGRAAELGSAAHLAEPARALWDRLGFPPDELTRGVVVTPACGLAAATEEYAVAALKRTVEIARVLAEAPERSSVSRR